ncbi:hypothetical protein DFJ63DRAFT_319268 [Scheffersomyces coipomensis]|uniref:uncharacterized protein n=1 Tax=Scheffersomyces coipomensis TaxID=1788519 RepID=UPI00315DB7F0
MDRIDSRVIGNVTDSYICASSDSEYGTMGYTETLNDRDAIEETADMINLAKDMDNFKENIGSRYKSHVKSDQQIDTPTKFKGKSPKVLNSIHENQLHKHKLQHQIKKNDGNVSLLFSSHSTPLVSKQNNTINNKWEVSNRLPEINELDNYAPITKIRQSIASVQRQNSMLNQARPIHNDSLFYSDTENEDGDDEGEEISEEDSGLDIKNNNNGHIKSDKQIPSVDNNGSFQESRKREVQRPTINEETPRTTPPHSQEEINSSKLFNETNYDVNMNDEVYKIIVNLKQKLEEERSASKLLREEVNQLKQTVQPLPPLSSASEQIEDISAPYPIELNFDDSTAQFHFENESTRQPYPVKKSIENSTIDQMMSENGKLRLDNNNLVKRVESLESQCLELNNEVKYLRHIKESTESIEGKKVIDDLTDDDCVPINTREIGIQVNNDDDEEEKEVEIQKEVEQQEIKEDNNNNKKQENDEEENQPISKVTQLVNTLEIRSFKFEIERLQKLLEKVQQQYATSQNQIQRLQQEEIGNQSDLMTESNCQDLFFKRYNLQKVDKLTKVQMSNIIKMIMMKLSIGEDLEANITCLGVYMKMSMNFIDELHEILYINNEFKPSQYLTQDGNDKSVDRLNDCMNDMIKNIEKLLQ